MKTVKKTLFFYLLRYAVGVLLYAGAALLSKENAPLFSMILFFVLGGLEALLALFESGKITDLRVLFSFSWFFGLGLSALKLSELSNPFTLRAVLAFGIFFFVFLGAYDFVWLLAQKKGEKTENAPKPFGNPPERRKAVFAAVFIVGALSITGLLMEAVRFSFAFPLFVKDTPHAYTEFHLTGVHYFVVSAVLVPVMTCYYLLTGKAGKAKKTALILLNALCLAVPVLLLSKLHLVFFFLFPLLLFLTMQKRFSEKRVIAFVAAGAVVIGSAFVVLTLARNYPEGYLQGIFQFKNPETPVAVQLPYMYVANNFENFNLMTMKLESYSHGVRMLFPFTALTGLKFVPAVNEFLYAPVYVTIRELNTVTILYDAYGDFGLVGTAVFGAALGALSSILSFRVRKRVTIFTALLYVEFASYLLLSFFTTWFSHPTTWFWFAAALAIGIFCKKKGEPIW